MIINAVRVDCNIEIRDEAPNEIQRCRFGFFSPHPFCFWHGLTHKHPPCCALCTYHTSNISQPREFKLPQEGIAGWFIGIIKVSRATGFQRRLIIHFFFHRCVIFSNEGQRRTRVWSRMVVEIVEGRKGEKREREKKGEGKFLTTSDFILPETAITSGMMMSNYVVSSLAYATRRINNKPSVLHDMSWHTMHLPHWRMSRRGKGMTSILVEKAGGWKKGSTSIFFYSVRPLHLFLAFELREYLLNAAPLLRSLSLS